MRRYILLVIAAALVIVYFAPSIVGRKEVSRFLLRDKEVVNAITVKRGNRRIQIQRDGSTWWIKDSKKRYKADSSKMEELLEAIKETRLENPVTEDKSKYATYGVAGDGDYIEIELDSGKRGIFTGKSGPRYSLRYIRLKGDDTVYLVRARFIDLLPGSVNDFRDRTILSLNPGFIREVQWNEGSKTLHMKKTKAGWQIIDRDGRVSPVEDKEVSGYLKALSRIVATGFPDDDRPPKDAIEEGYIKITADRVYTIRLYRKKKGEEYYLTDPSGAYRISKYTKEGLFRELKPLGSADEQPSRNRNKETNPGKDT